MGYQTVSRPLPTQASTNTDKRTLISMTRVGFEPTIPVFERAKKKKFSSFPESAVSSSLHQVEILETYNPSQCYS
jgi:hypothetical protein